MSELKFDRARFDAGEMPVRTRNGTKVRWCAATGLSDEDGPPNMTDRELLEAAAKAAGWSTQSWRWESDSDGFSYRVENILRYWNPLTDDGDALRLAVRCELSVCISNRAAWAHQDENSCVGKTAASSLVMFVDANNDRHAAARRAIVLAAATIEEE